MDKSINKDKGFNLNLISKYRGELFGFSIISIIVFHFFMNIINNCSEGAAYNIARVYDNAVGSIGVEIFLFLSGMGLYFSMKKNSDVKQFYFKRMVKVLIPYVIWGGLYWIGADIISGNHSILDFFLDFSFVTFWTRGVKALWYIGFILIMYIAFPLIFKLFDNEKYGFLWFCALLTFSVCLSAVVRLAFLDVFKNIEIAISRVPIFLIGAYIGKRVYRKDEMKTADFLVALFGLLWQIFYLLQRYEVIPLKWGLIRYKNVFFSIFLIYLLVWVFSKVKLERLKAFLRSTGAISLELYMTHVTIDNVLESLGFHTYKTVTYIVIVILSIIFSILLHFVMKKITMKLVKH